MIPDLNEAEAYAIECRQLKTAKVAPHLRAIEGEVGVCFVQKELIGYEGPESGRIIERDGLFGIEPEPSSTSYSPVFWFPAYFVDSIDFDCDGGTLLILASDNGRDFETTVRDLGEFNEWAHDEEDQSFNRRN